MKNFDTDELRAIVVLAGLFGLFFMLLLYSFTSVTPNQGLIGAFGTMVGLPFGASALERLAEKRNGPPPDDPPPPRQLEQPPPPPPERRGTDITDFMVAGLT